MAATIDALEHAAFKAWPCVHAERVDGWLVRTAGGYTKRANSANWVAADTLAPGEIIARCTALFEAAAIRPVFRLVERPETVAVDGALAAAGWHELDPSIVMTAPVDCPLAAVSDGGAWSLLPMPEWAAVHARLAGQDTGTAERHLGILSRITQPALPAVMHDAGEIVACGLAVADRGLLGFFDILTAPHARGRGFATRLMAGQVAAARRLGIEILYLQVVAGNTPAIALYSKLGFRETYRYRYRAR